MNLTVLSAFMQRCASGNKKAGSWGTRPSFSEALRLEAEAAAAVRNRAHQTRAQEQYRAGFGDDRGCDNVQLVDSKIGAILRAGGDAKRCPCKTSQIVQPDENG